MCDFCSISRSCCFDFMHSVELQRKDVCRNQVDLGVSVVNTMNNIFKFALIFVSVLPAVTGRAKAQPAGYNPVPESDVKLETAYKYVTACMKDIQPLDKKHSVVLAGLTGEKDCETSFSHYAVYLGDQNGKPLKYLGEETARMGTFDPAAVYLKGHGPGFAVVEQEDNYGYARTRYYFSLDPADKAMPQRREYSPVGISSFSFSSGGIYFLSDTSEVVIGRIALDGKGPGPVSILKSRSGRNALTGIVGITNDKDGFAVKMETGRYVFSDDDWEFVTEPEVGPEAPQPAGIALNYHSAIDSSVFSTATSNTWPPVEPKQKNVSARPTISSVSPEGITVYADGLLREYRLPPPAREEVVKHIPEDCSPSHSIGPYVVYPDSAVFGISVYSGEGNCGVGGLGFFTAEGGKYEIRRYKDLVPYSSTALLISGSTAYVGLSHEAEYSSSPEGLAEVNMVTGAGRILKLNRKVRVLFERDGYIFVGAEDGGYIIYPDGRMARLNLDLDADGNCLYSLVGDLHS